MKNKGVDLVNLTMLYSGLLVMLTTLSGISAGDAFATTMYKWVDAEGNVNYTQTPPETDAEYTKLKPPPKIETEQAQENLQQRQQLLDELREQRHKKAAEQQATEEEKARRRKNCELARENLKSYVKPRVQFVQEDGSRVRASEEQRQEQIKKAQEMIKEFCD